MWRVVVALFIVMGCSESPAERPPDPEASIVTVDRTSGVRADGSDSATITISLRDSDGSPSPGHQITVEAPSDVHVGEIPLTDVSGQTHAGVASTVAGSKLLTVAVDGVVLDSITIEFEPGPPDRLLFLQSPASAEAGSALSPVKVAFTDAFENVVTTQTDVVTITLITNGAVSLKGTKTIVAQQGIASFDNLSISSPVTGVVLRASSTAFAPVDSAAFDVVLGEPAATTSTMTVAPATVVADGLAIATITVSLKNAAGFPLPNYALMLSASGAGANFYPAAIGTTDAMGSFTTQLSSTVSESKTVTLTAMGLVLMRSVEFVQAPCTLRLPGPPLTATPWPSSALVTADFDSDGHQDVALGGFGGIALLRGTGTARFHAAFPYATTMGVRGMEAGDFDGDGDSDLVAAADTAVYVFINTGTGQFVQSTLTTNAHALAVTVGDFDTDGSDDFAVRGDYVVAIYRGLGNGTFEAPVNYTLDVPAYSASVAAIGAVDLNNDGRRDLLTHARGYRSVLLGTATGSFQLLASVNAAPADTGQFATPDVNGDGKPDLVRDGYLHIGNGDGTFGSATYLAAPFRGALGTVAADLDGDGHQDIISGSSNNYASIDIAFGNGNATFAPLEQWQIGQLPLGIDVVDLNEDGHLDVVVASGDNNSFTTMAVLEGDGTGRLTGATHHGATAGSFFSTAADFDGNGTLDFVARNQTTQNIGIQLAAANGTLTAMPTVTTNTAEAIPGDFDADGKLDIVGLDNGIAWFRGNGAGGLAAKVSSAMPPGWAVGLIVADLDGDAFIDAAMVNPINDAVTVAFGNGNGTWSAAAQYTVAAAPQQVRAVDIDADGDRDLIVVSLDNPSINVLVNGGNRTFAAAVRYPCNGAPYGVAVGDFSGDGVVDVAVSNEDANTISLLVGNGDATFQSAAQRNVGIPTHQLEALDIDHDGAIDLVSRWANLTVIRGRGDGTFLQYSAYGMGYTGAVVVRDFDGDGWEDVFGSTGSSAYNGYVFLGNRGCSN
jgi:hypothetical protein